MTNTLRQQIKKILHSILGPNEHREEIGDEESLVNSGLLCSLQIVELATVIETDFGVDFSSIGFDVYYFESVVAVEELISKHQRLGC